MSTRLTVVCEGLPSVTLRAGGCPSVNNSVSLSSSAASFTAVTVKVCAVSLVPNRTNDGTPL